MKKETLYWIPERNCLLYVYDIIDNQLCFKATTYLRDVFTNILTYKVPKKLFESGFYYIEVNDGNYERILSKNNSVNSWKVIPIDDKYPSSIPFYDDGIHSSGDIDISNHYQKYAHWS